MMVTCKCAAGTVADRQLVCRACWFACPSALRAEVGEAYSEAKRCALKTRTPLARVLARDTRYRAARAAVLAVAEARADIAVKRGGHR